MYSVIHKRVFTPLRGLQLSGDTLDNCEYFRPKEYRPISNSTMTYKFAKTPMRNFCDFVNQYAFVELDKWSIAPINRVGSSFGCMKTLL